MDTTEQIKGVQERSKIKEYNKKIVICRSFNNIQRRKQKTKNSHNKTSQLTPLEKNQQLHIIHFLHLKASKISYI